MREPHALPDVVVPAVQVGSAAYFDLVHPDDVDSLAALVDLAGLDEAHAIVRIRDDERGWLLVEHRARVVEENLVLERIDVTARERDRAKADRTDAYWRTVLKNGHEALAVIDPDDRLIRHASDHLGELAGIEPAELTDRFFLELVHGADRADVESAINGLGTGVERMVVECRLSTAGSEPLWVEAVLSDARRDPEVAAIVVNIRDIQDRKRADQQLRASAHLFRVLIGHLADGALVVGGAGSVEFVSERASEILGLEASELLGRPAPLRIRSDGHVALSVDPHLALAGVATIPSEVAGPHNRWYELTSHDLRDDPVVNGTVLVLRDITDRRNDVEQLRHQLELDALTGLVNRRGLEARVEERLAAGERLRLAFLDLNGFKAVNDSHGHGLGDELLRQVAARLLRSTRSGDIVARIGGDEFVVATSLDHAGDPDGLSRRIVDVIAGAYRLGPVEVHVGASGGASDVGGDVDLATALRRADLRMYEDKRKQASGGLPS